MAFLRKHPWLLVVLAFAALIAATAALIVIAERHKPTPVPLEHERKP